MTFALHGKHLIAGDGIETDARFRNEPATGPVHDFSVGTMDLVNRACVAAEAAFRTYGHDPRTARAAFLGAIAASSNFGATSVGPLSIRRFLRPVAFQNVPLDLLPEASQ